MKNLIEYNYSCTNAMFNFLKDNDLDALLEDLKRIEGIVSRNQISSANEASLWFRFGSDDTLSTTIRNIEVDLASSSNNDHKYMIENFEMVTKDINHENELRVYYS